MRAHLHDPVPFHVIQREIMCNVRGERSVCILFDLGIGTMDGIYAIRSAQPHSNDLFAMLVS